MQRWWGVWVVPVVAVALLSLAVVVVAWLRHERQIVSLRKELRVEMSSRLIDRQIVAIGQRIVDPSAADTMADTKLVDVVNVSEHPQFYRSLRLDIADALQVSDLRWWQHPVPTDCETVVLHEKCADCFTEGRVVWVIGRRGRWLRANVPLQERERDPRGRVSVVLNPDVDTDGLA